MSAGKIIVLSLCWAKLVVACRSTANGGKASSLYGDQSLLIVRPFCSNETFSPTSIDVAVGSSIQFDFLGSPCQLSVWPESNPCASHKLADRNITQNRASAPWKLDVDTYVRQYVSFSDLQLGTGCKEAGRLLTVRPTFSLPHSSAATTVPSGLTQPSATVSRHGALMGSCRSKTGTGTSLAASRATIQSSTLNGSWNDSTVPATISRSGVASHAIVAPSATSSPEPSNAAPSFVPTSYRILLLCLLWMGM